MEAKLILPCDEYLDSFLVGCQEFANHGIKAFSLPDPTLFDV